MAWMSHHTKRVPAPRYTGAFTEWLTRRRHGTKTSWHTHDPHHGSGAHSDPRPNVTTGDQPKIWRATTREPSRPGLFPNMHGLGNARDVHVGKNDLDVGTEDQVNEFGSDETEGNHVSDTSDGSFGG